MPWATCARAALSPNIVKIDRGLLLQAQSNPRAKSILPKLVKILHDLDAKVVCEGIETPAQWQIARQVGIIAPSAYNPVKDQDLRLIDASHLFARNTTVIAVRRGHYLRGYAYRFIELCAPELTEANVRSSVSPHRENGF